MNERVIRLNHALVEHSLTILRDRSTSMSDFRRHTEIVSVLLLAEATRDLETIVHSIETPLSSFNGRQLSENIVFVPILRAGLAMLFSVSSLLPACPVGFIGLERDEKTAVAHQYYEKFPPLNRISRVVVLDPMLATGGSFCDTVLALQERTTAPIFLLSIVAAPEGIARVNESFPEITIVTAAIDDHLNDKKYIVPGLGDFGDRYFGTV